MSDTDHYLVAAKVIDISRIRSSNSLTFIQLRIAKKDELFVTLFTFEIKILY
jgi:hypothetical protein